MVRLSPLVGGLLLAVLVPFAFTADGKTNEKPDWPQWRGPNRDDHSPDTGLLKEWPKDGPPLAWKATGIGEGFSSVAVVGDKVFTMGDVKDESLVFALSREKGDKVWSVKVGKAGGNYKGPRCTPTVDGDRVYALGQDGDLVCLKVADGSEVWRKNFVKDFGGKAGHWNYTESPLIDGDKLVCTPGGKNAIVALNKMTGDVIWKSEIASEAQYSSPVISTAGGVRQYVQLLRIGTVGLNAKDGKLLWNFDKVANSTANIPTPIIMGDQVFTTSGYNNGGGLVTLVSESAGTLASKEEYFLQALNNKHGGVVQIGDYLYGDHNDDGKPWCVEWKTGKIKTDWLKGVNKEGKGSASMTYADGYLYIHYANGYVALVEANPDGYKEKGLFKLANYTKDSWSHPVVIGGRLYQREQDTLWVYDVKAK